MSGRVSLNVISIWVSGLSQVDCPPCCGWAFSNLLRPNQDKRQKEEEFSLFCLPNCLIWDTHIIFSDLPPLAPQAFGLKLNYTTGFPRYPHNRCLYLLLVLFL